MLELIWALMYLVGDWMMPIWIVGMLFLLGSGWGTGSEISDDSGES